MMGALRHDNSMFNSGMDKAILEEEYGHAAAVRVVKLSPEPVPMKAADMTQQQRIAEAMMKAGISNPAAWAAAGVMNAGSNVSTSVPSATASAPMDGFDAHPAAVVMKGKNDPTFLISWRSQREVASTLGWKCALMIWGGPAIFLVSLYGLLTLTHLI